MTQDKSHSDKTQSLVDQILRLKKCGWVEVSKGSRSNTITRAKRRAEKEGLNREFISKKMDDGTYRIYRLS